MTTVLIEEYAILRVAIQHTLETALRPESVMAIDPRKLSEISMSLARPVDLLVLGISGQTDNDVQMLTSALSLLELSLIHI